MKVNALDKEWEIKPITPQKQQELYVGFMACQSENQTVQEKEKMYGLFFKALELSGIKDAPESLVDMSILGMAILTEYCGFDKKKLSEQGSVDG